MSEPETHDDATIPAPSRPPLGLRAGGVAIAGLAVGLRLIEPDGPLALASWGAGMLVLALALFGGSGGARIVANLGASKTHPPDTDIEPSTLQPVRILGFGSAAIGGIGVLWVLDGVRLATAATGAWWVVVAGATGLLTAGIWSAVLDQTPAALRVEPPQSAARRRLIALAVAAALLAEVAIPATYYFGDDRFDERFAWRMFSDVRVYRCQLGAYDIDDGRATPVNLPATIHVAWINTMRRSREGVLRRYLRWRCDVEDIDGARVVNQCRTPEGESVPRVVREIDCGSGHVTSVEVE